jgi:hypothetical protein
MMKLNIYFLKKATEHLRAEKEVKDFYAQLGELDNKAKLMPKI